jgi:hypothetical protein
MGEEDSVENLARGIYGTILSTALITAYSEDPGSDPLQVAVAVAVTTIVFWIAHAYADALARSAGDVSGLARAKAELVREWPIVLGALPPLLPLLLAPVGVLSDDGSESVAIATGIGVLAGWGMVIAWRRGRGWLRVIGAAVASATFGLIVVALKAIVH